MAEGSGVGARVSVGRIPVLDGVRDLLDRGVAPGGTRRNLESTLGAVAWRPSLTEEERLLMCDAQTSGGLLISVPEERTDELLRELKAGGVETRAVVGSGGRARRDARRRRHRSCTLAAASPSRPSSSASF